MTRSVAIVAAIQSVLFALVGLLVLDMRAHHRVEELGGVNVRGYRGAVMNQKRANEIRIAAAGGDLAYGWGVAAEETLVMYARRRVALGVQSSADRQREVTAVNLAARGARPGEYASWIAGLAPLKIDVLCLIPDPPDHAPGEGRFLPDRHSLLFQSTGYSPIVPLVLREKAAVTGIAPLRAVAAVLDAADVQRRPALDPAQSYQSAIAAAVAAGARVAASGVVIAWPTHAAAAAGRLAAVDPRVRTVDLEDYPQTQQAAVRLDGYHWSAAGHSLAADAVAPAILALLDAAERR